MLEYEENCRKIGEDKSPNIALRDITLGVTPGSALIVSHNQNYGEFL